MSQTNKYDFDLTDYGTVGWNALLKGSIEDVDAFLHSRIAGSAGTGLSLGNLVYLDSNGKYSLAEAAAGKVPCAGIALEAGAKDANVRIVRLGPWVAFSSGMTPGAKLYVSATAGVFTQTKPSAFSQAVGRALNATDIFVWIEDVIPIHYGTGDPPTPTGYPDGTVYFKHA
ncbi:MAG: hypothetical protein ACYTBJ_00915 [Planctomycetota bacterium]|jgi:hypothetical protein